MRSGVTSESETVRCSASLASHVSTAGTQPCCFLAYRVPARQPECQSMGLRITTTKPHVYAVQAICREQQGRALGYASEHTARHHGGVCSVALAARDMAAPEVAL